MRRIRDIPARIVIAGLATASSQKVHNLRCAAASLDDDVDVLAFIDSDARPARDWLRQLVRRLGPRGTQATTSYRWFAPLRPTLPNLLLASLDHSLLPLSCPGRNYLVWGGSWAIRRDVFEAIGLPAIWNTALSDDLSAAQALSAARVHIEFEPMAIVASPLDVSWSGMFSFLRRQFMVVRWNRPGWWLVGLLLTLFSQGMFWGSAALEIGLASRGSPWCLVPAAVVAALYGCHVTRAVMRRQAAGYYLPGWQARSTALAYFDLCFHPLAALLNLVALVASGWGRTLRWRGIRYERMSGGAMRVGKPSPAAPNFFDVSLPRETSGQGAIARGSRTLAAIAYPRNSA